MTEAAPAYAGSLGKRKFKRIRLALFLSSLAACLGVTLVGGIGSGVLALFGAAAGLDAVGAAGEASLMGGVNLGVQLATFNFFLFFITVPAAALALGLSIGRMPYRGIFKRIAYLRWGAIWGAILVGGTTTLFGLLIGGPLPAIGALLSGTLVGGLAGIGCGFLFHAIVRPADQVADIDINVF